MWRALGSRLAVVVFVLAAAACGPEPTATPPAPFGAVRVGDWAEFDQERANQLRLGLSELAQRFPSGEALDIQIWRLPPTATWDQVRSHYAQQAGWQPNQALQATESAVAPDAQIFVDSKRVTRLDVALFRARRGAAADTAVLIVRRSRM